MNLLSVVVEREPDDLPPGALEAAPAVALHVGGALEGAGAVRGDKALVGALALKHNKKPFLLTHYLQNLKKTLE